MDPEDALLQKPARYDNRKRIVAFAKARFAASNPNKPPLKASY